MPRPLLDRTGQRYGKLIVVQFAGIKQHQTGRSTLWLCRCDCGNEIKVFSGSLGSGRSINCGCARKLTSGEAARNEVLHVYQVSAQKRGYAWELTDEDFDRLTSQDCFYCGEPPNTVKRTRSNSNGEFVYNGIDRVDNAFGYAPENVVTACTTCNMIKRNLSFDDFLAKIDKISTHQANRRNICDNLKV